MEAIIKAIFVMSCYIFHIFRPLLGVTLEMRIIIDTFPLTHKAIQIVKMSLRARCLGWQSDIVRTEFQQRLQIQSNAPFPTV